MNSVFNIQTLGFENWVDPLSKEMIMSRDFSQILIAFSLFHRQKFENWDGIERKWEN